jgi:hypothetical protein
MGNMRASSTWLLVAAIVSIELNSSAAAAPIVWSGLTKTFTKANGANPLISTNQDHITANVALTRGSTQGLFNGVVESSYDKGPNTRPTGTAWATILNNPGKTIAATNFAALTFSTWKIAYGNAAGQNILNRDAVVHLISEDIYLDARFTAWTSAGAGGGFTYSRSQAPSPTGDYNGNSTVDAGDYVLWRRTLGQTASPAGSGADGDSSGTIGGGDFDYWRARFGNTVSASGTEAAAQIPEAASIIYSLGSVTFLSLLRWRTRTNRS